MGFADDLINNRKKREESSEDFANQVINGTYRVPTIKVSPDFSGLSKLTNSIKQKETNQKQDTSTTKNKKTSYKSSQLQKTMAEDEKKQQQKVDNQKLQELLKDRYKVICV